jgi:aspartate aminotransferase
MPPLKERDPVAISSRVAEAMERSSWIRRMFEEGLELKKRFGEAAVCDLSLGNPDLEPPPAFREALAALAADPTPGTHRYMPNMGFDEARAAVAAMIAREQGVDPGKDGVCMTVGAAGALNVLMKSVLDPGCEVLVPSPFFPEYEFYADNHGGKLVPVATRPDFGLDFAALEAAIGPSTRMILLNAPNNPTGKIYPASDLARLGALLDAKAPQATLVADEPYRRLVYGNVTVPSILAATPRSVVASSFSKDLGLAGERIGFLAVHPAHPDRAKLLPAAGFANRTLGFVNAPALLQRLVARLTHERVDTRIYAERLSMMLAGLKKAGYRCVAPEGGMFLFPASPEADDVAFAKRLARDEKVLVVPGAGFGAPGFFRVSLAVPGEILERSLPGFARAARR